MSFGFGAADIYAASQDPKGGIRGTSTAVFGGSSDFGDVIVEKRR